jgi:hypothetical protein
VSLNRRILWVAVVAAAGLATTSDGSEADLSTTVSGPLTAPRGESQTFTVEYSNHGPDACLFGYVNLHIPSGVPARLDSLSGDQFDALQASAAGTDTLGNTPLLFVDQATCESLFFQLQGPSPPQPVQGLGPGGSGSFTFDLPIPMDPPVFGKVKITHPAHLAREFYPALTNHRLYFDAEPADRYSRGGNCDNVASGCSQLDDCFGPRLSLVEPLSGGLEVVDDGSEFADPAQGCNSLIEFTAGRIAVVRRGGCNFFEKANNAQRAGAIAVVLVNDGRCQNLGPDSPDCLINMLGGVAAGDIDIPIVMLSVNDGEPVISELEGGGVVTVSMGAVAGGKFELDSFGFSTDAGEVDPVPANNGDAHRVLVVIFGDGFDTGNTDEWSTTQR